MSPDVKTPFINCSYSAAFHLLSYAFLLGMTIWHSYISSTIARRTLPREQLGSLQSKLFPVYFFLQTVLNGLCLLTTSNHNAHIIFIIGVICGLLNLTLLGPRTTRLMKERLKKEREEGKKYNEAGISEQFKSLNKQFGVAHGFSVVLNLVITLSLIAYPFILSPIIV